MSKERHPNINAAGMTIDILESLRKRSRGNAKLHIDKWGDDVYALVADFVVQMSEQLDKDYGTVIGCEVKK